jgi:hypothetical protein
MATRRCSSCSTNWPATSEFVMCPGCDEGTAYISNDDPDGDAKEMAKVAEFETFYRARGEREVRIDWAKYQLEQIAELEGIPVLDDDPS